LLRGWGAKTATLDGRILLLKYLHLRSKYAWILSNMVAAARINLLAEIGLWNWLEDPIPGKAEEKPAPAPFPLS
jgi:hypothetical protein